MAETFLSDTQLGARYGVHRTTPWSWVKDDPSFPKPVKLSRQVTRRRLSDIEAWEKSKITVAA